uniref:Uncharacterized protein n=1 Tax=Ignisphaera aggregans TaxID=334771 RepID=A0A7C4FIL4_9CREN
MWFLYRKSPLGTVVKESMKAVLGLFKGDEVLKAVETFRRILGIEIRVISIDSASLNHLLPTIDPDLMDIIRNVKCCENNCYLLIASWYGE